MTKAVRFTQEQLFKFIELYRDREVLWNNTNRFYRLTRKRESAIQEIANEMNIDGFGLAEIIKKIRSIRNTYIQEKNKIKKSIKSGATPEEVYKPQLSWFKLADSFLCNVVGREGRGETINGRHVGNLELHILRNHPEEKMLIAMEREKQRTAGATVSHDHAQSPEEAGQTSGRKREATAVPVMINVVKEEKGNLYDDENEYIPLQPPDDSRGQPSVSQGISKSTRSSSRRLKNCESLSTAKPQEKRKRKYVDEYKELKMRKMEAEIKAIEGQTKLYEEMRDYYAVKKEMLKSNDTKS